MFFNSKQDGRTFLGRIGMEKKPSSSGEKRRLMA
jgi:hypothetical protein